MKVGARCGGPHPSFLDESYRESMYSGRSMPLTGKKCRFWKLS
jgi:hypothetical protein